MNNKSERVPAAGKPSFLISKLWLGNYKKYILYDECEETQQAKLTRKDLHSGPITNDEDLCDLDYDKNL